MMAPTEAAQQNHSGKHSLVIDDILSTGSPVTASTRALLSTGASHIDVLCVRVI